MTKKALLLFAFMLGLLASSPLFAQQQDSPFRRGAGSFEYSGYDPIKKPITLFYYIPTQGDIRKMRVLFSMHGDERSGYFQRNVWRNLAEEHGFIVLSPQFSRENKWMENDYQFGGVSKSDKEFIPKPKEEWTYAIIEHLFDYFKVCTGNTAKVYDMFGHSAGGQFVHRYLLMTPHARVGKAVAANPGNYTYPDDTIPLGWPYSLYGTPFATDEYLVPFFKRKLTILIGTKDTELATARSPKLHVYAVQGIHRYDRAWKFFNACQFLAQKKGYQFNWSIGEVPDAGHGTPPMVFGNVNVRSKEIEKDKKTPSSVDKRHLKVFNNEDVTNIGAYHIIFEK